MKIGNASISGRFVRRRVTGTAGILFCLFFLGGCSYFRGETSPGEPRFTKAGLGAATGAAVGAGLGAVIGSTSGNAGEGLAIGSVAGAVAGGAVGSEMQSRESKLAYQRNMLAKQQTEIDAGREDLRSLREGMFEIPRTNSPSWKPDIAPDKYRGNPTAKSLTGSAVRSGASNSALSPKAAPAADTGVHKQAKQPAASARKAPMPAAAAKASTPGERAPVLQPELPGMEEPLTAAKAPSGEEDLLGEEYVSEKRLAAKQPVKQTAANNLPPARQTPAVEESAPAAEPLKALAKKEEPSKAGKSESAALPAGSSNCSEADAEAVRARTSASDADKLFYLRRALRLCPKDPSYHVELGRVYSAIGRTDDARFEFNKALDIDPENQPAQEELSMLMLEENKTAGKTHN